MTAIRYYIARHKSSGEYHLLMDREILGRFKTRKAAETEAMMRTCNEASARWPTAVTAGKQGET